MKTLDELRIKVSESAEARGHSLRWVSPWHGEARSIQYGECVHCGKGVAVCTRPSPNGIDIAGEAVALNCKWWLDHAS